MADYDGTTNTFTSGGVPPELQRVIDQVMSYASKPVGGARGITAAQGRAMGGIAGDLSGIAKETMDLQARERMAAEANKSHLEAAKIGITPAMESLAYKKTTIPGTARFGLTGGIGTQTSPSSDGSVNTNTLDSWRNLFNF